MEHTKLHGRIYSWFCLVFAGICIPCYTLLFGHSALHHRWGMCTVYWVVVFICFANFFAWYHRLFGRDYADSKTAD